MLFRRVISRAMGAPESHNQLMGERREGVIKNARARACGAN